MRIAFIVPALVNKGPVIVAKDLCACLVKWGYDCSVFYFDAVDRELAFPCVTQRINFGRKVDLNQYDIVHIHCLRPAIYAWLHKPFYNKPLFVSTLHQPLTMEAYRLVYNCFISFCLSKIQPVLYNAFDCNVVLSKVQEKLSSSMLSTPLEVIGNGRNFETMPVVNDEDILFFREHSKYKIVGTISVVIKLKGLEQIVRALTLLPKEYIYVCIGDGCDLSRLQDLATQLGVADRCYWFGNRRDAINYYQYFDVFALCSYSEGFPLALIEAAANGCSCVLSDIEILKVLVPENYVCFYKLEDVPSLAEKIREAYDNKEKLGNAIYAYYKEKWTADRMASKYLALYKKLIKEKYDC